MNSNDAPQDPESWSELWQQDDPPLAKLDAAALRRKSRRFRAGLIVINIVEMFICVGAVAWMVMRALESGRWVSWVGVAVVLGLVVVAEWLTLKNRRGTYQPANHTAAAYLDLEVLRLRRMIRTSRFMVKFMAAELLLFIPWVFLEIAVDPENTHRATAEMLIEMVMFGLGTLATVGLASWLWRRRLEKSLSDAVRLREAFDG